MHHRHNCKFCPASHRYFLPFSPSLHPSPSHFSRFQNEAAPILARLLSAGTAYVPPPASGGTLPTTQANTKSGAGGGGIGGGVCADDAAAPGALQRVRVAALGCLEAVCGCRDAWAAVRGLTWGMAQVRQRVVQG